ncbi:unnamed protein product [Vitrella brassicaformis CCMP3155]|uniref:Apple domain-containing protein n=1 Tax=Vitrella brassicaformis (strain CCMP3155) TaxID=1169540 RepID=A0A0G4GX24_VITBC|nr:unnamed protein product [Vitrella brassicaformis CCMP3155]|eukprot:CEM35568.1 unnamed protein product [Vitrella brassicaformis CCMP3155]
MTWHFAARLAVSLLVVGHGQTAPDSRQTRGAEVCRRATCEKHELLYDPDCRDSEGSQRPHGCGALGLSCCRLCREGGAEELPEKLLQSASPAVAEQWRQKGTLPLCDEGKAARAALRAEVQQVQRYPIAADGNGENHLLFSTTVCNELGGTLDPTWFACCAPGCSKCDASSCGTRAEEEDGCCPEKIAEAGRSCHEGEAPCIADNYSPTYSSCEAAPGLLNAERTVCCPTTCGSCGKTGCDMLAGGSEECCDDAILKANNLCFENGVRRPPPCIPVRIKNLDPHAEPKVLSITVTSDTHLPSESESLLRHTYMQNDVVNLNLPRFPLFNVRAETTASTKAVRFATQDLRMTLGDHTRWTTRLDTMEPFFLCGGGSGKKVLSCFDEDVASLMEEQERQVSVTAIPLTYDGVEHLEGAFTATFALMNGEMLPQAPNSTFAECDASLVADGVVEEKEYGCGDTILTHIPSETDAGTGFLSNCGSFNASTHTRIFKFRIPPSTIPSKQTVAAALTVPREQTSVPNAMVALVSDCSGDGASSCIATSDESQGAAISPAACGNYECASIKRTLGAGTYYIVAGGLGGSSGLLELDIGCSQNVECFQFLPLNDLPFGEDLVKEPFPDYSEGECAEACLADTMCGGYTFLPQCTGNQANCCYLKSLKAVERGAEMVFSGRKVVLGDVDHCFAVKPNMDYGEGNNINEGDPFRNLQEGQCANKCVETDDCLAYQYIRNCEGTGTGTCCYLKNALAEPVEKVGTHFAGILLR